MTTKFDAETLLGRSANEVRQRIYAIAELAFAAADPRPDASFYGICGLAVAFVKTGKAHGVALAQLLQWVELAYADTLGATAETSETFETFETRAKNDKTTKE